MTSDHDDGYVLALDVGGTGLKGALIGPDRRHVRYQERRPTRRAAGPDAVVEGVLGFAHELYETGRDRYGAPPLAAGVIFPGIVDEERGTAVYAANLGWRDVPLRRLLSERLHGTDVRVGHDVRAGGLAEARLGAGARAAGGRFFFVSLGTGIACAISTGDGRMETGAHGGAGELGHIVVRPGGEKCGCGQYGCLETLASAAAVTRAWALACGDPTATAADAARAVDAGDPAALAVWDTAVDALADGLLTGISLLDPELVIIGGGLGEAGETLLTPLRAALTRKATFQRLPDLVPAALGDAAGSLGAGLLAWDAVTAAGTPAGAGALPHAPKGRSHDRH
ncbi:ROK family protein [Streptomyces sp. JH002]|uniref:ROK family protein n=1 Tax=Streptomyces sp. JH002 TaxID=2763259 RepID=UPI003D803AD5